MFATCITRGLRGQPWAWEPEPRECACCVEAKGEEVYVTCPPEDAAHNLDDHCVAWFEEALRSLHDGDPLFESSEKRTELRELGYSE